MQNLGRKLFIFPATWTLVVESIGAQKHASRTLNAIWNFSFEKKKLIKRWSKKQRANRMCTVQIVQPQHNLNKMPGIAAMEIVSHMRLLNWCLFYRLSFVALSHTAFEFPIQGIHSCYSDNDSGALNTIRCMHLHNYNALCLVNSYTQYPDFGTNRNQIR